MARPLRPRRSPLRNIRVEKKMANEELFGDDTAIDRGWRDSAACFGRTELFFPRRAERPEARQRREAKAAAICATCVVRTACQHDARVNREYGFWGGESEEQRHLAGFTLAAPIGLRGRTDAG